MWIDPNMPTLELAIPAVDEYRALRVAAGLSAKSAEAADAGLKNSWASVCVREQGELIGMGRIVGDGGLFLLVVDIAVTPSWQRKGLGARIMHALMDELHARAPKTAHVALIADGTACELYRKFGFTMSAPGAHGMQMRL
jgi:GNAT superfamily N-acetyltransferase